MEYINGVTCIKGEIHNIMTLFRLSTRWAAHNNRFSSELLIQDENPLIRLFHHLNEQLEGIYDLKMVDCVLYLQPFRYIIISDTASGPLTSAALSSISKFVLYGFLSPDFPRASEGINLIANCIPKCIFVETDWESDEVILMKLLELSGLCLQSSSAGLLTVTAAWEIYSTCMSIHSQQKASKLLKSEAESVLRHLTQTSFSRATNILNNQSPNENDLWDHSMYGKFSVESGTWEKVSLRYNLSGSIGISLLLVKIMTSLCHEIDPNRKPLNLENIKFFLSLINIALEAGGPGLGEIETLVAILRGDVCRHLLNCSQSDDLGVFSLSLRVVFNLFASIKNHMKVQLEVFLTSVHLRILHPSTSTTLASSSSSASSTAPHNLLLAREELALESLLEFCREPSLMYDIYTNYDCDMQCTNLFDSIVSTLCCRASPSGLSKPPQLSNSRNSSLSINILNRLAIEGVLVILHTVATSCEKMSQYQLSLQSSTPTVVKQNSGVLSDVDKWCLEGVEEDEEDDAPANGHTKSFSSYTPNSANSEDDFDLDLLVSARAKSAEVLRQRRLKKQRMRLAAEKFNEKPLGHEWVRFAADLSLLPKIQIGMEATSKGAGAGLCEARHIAQFLKSTPGLGKTQVGEYLSRGPVDKYPFHAEVLREYVNTFDFSPSTSFVEALRIFLGHFRLPGEAQAIDRLMEAFAARVFTFLGVGNPFVSADAAFILAFSTIMLNTDLHNKNMTTKMKLDEFVRNNRGINGGKDLPREFLENLYHEIKNRELMVDAAVTDISGLPQERPLYSDDASWMKLLRKGLADQAPASFTPTVMARRGVSGDDLAIRGNNLEYIPFSVHEKDMFLVMAKHVLDVILEVWCCSDDDILLSRILSGFCDFASICMSLDLKDHLDSLLQLAAAFSVDLVERGSQLQFDMKSPLIAINFDQLSEFGPFFRSPSLSALEPNNSSDSPLTIGGGDGGSDLQNKWLGLRLVRGHALLQFFFYEYGKCFSLLTKGSHYSFVRLLLWGRGHHVLPRELVELDDFTDSRGGPLLPSIFCQKYKEKLREEMLFETETGEETEASIWASVTGLFWQAPPERTAKAHSKRKKIQLSPSSMQLLEFCFTGKKFNELLFLNTRSLSDTDLVSVIDCMLAEVLGHQFIVPKLLTQSNSFYSGRHQAKLLSFLFNDSSESPESKVQDDFMSKRPPSQISELDAVLVLEWVGRVVFLNRRRADCVWALVHEYLQYILQYSVCGISENSPFLVERAVVAVIRAAMHLIQVGDNDEKNLSSSVWNSVGLIMEVPHGILLSFAERLGAGLISLVRGSPGVAALTTVEHWFLIFSLLSCICPSDRGRFYVWEILCYLIKENLISNLNFTPCRDLVIQFINRDNGEKIGHIEGDTLIGGGLHIMKLTLMALGGYKYYLDEKNTSTTPHFMNFTLPSPDSFHPTPRSSSSSSTGSGSGGSSSSTVTAEYEMTVICINFLHVEEVVNLWLDSVKILSDLSQLRPLEVSKNSLFCLKAILLGGSFVGLPPQIWIEAWSELLQRLPLNIEKLIAPDPRLKRLSLEKQDAVDISYRASTLIFDLLIGHYRSIRMMEQFQSLWLRTISHLASGVQVIGSGNIQNEFIEMISSLFRILSSNSRSKCDLSLHETAPNNGTTPSSSSLCHQETPSSSSLPTHQDTILLQISWHAARANCPQLLQILKKSNPIILEIIQTTGNGHVPMKPAGVNSSSAGTGTPNGASEGSSTMNFTESYRNLYSRLFESKSQVV